MSVTGISVGSGTAVGSSVGAAVAGTSAAGSVAGAGAQALTRIASAIIVSISLNIVFFIWDLSSLEWLIGQDIYKIIDLQSDGLETDVQPPSTMI
jgi:hypothetical protein